MAVTRRLRLDPIRCSGHGMCAALYPEGITLDDWGYPMLADGPIVGRELEHARRAVRACPDVALSIVADPPPGR